MDDLLLGIDVGTTGTKAVLLDLSGRVLSQATSEYELIIPQPGWAEQEPEDWWEAVGHSARQVLDDVPDAARRVRALGVSSQAPAMLPVDRDGIPVRKALIWMDRRAEEESRFIESEMGKVGIEHITGNLPDSFYVAPKILWYRRNEKENFSRTSLFLQVNSYINFRLTGRFSIDSVHATLLQLRDFKQNSWSEEICNICGVDPGMFPELMEGHEILGEVTREASEFTGLMPGTPVIAGTVDGAAAAIEAGAISSGKVAEMTGTSTVLLMPNTKGIIETSFIAMKHALPGQHLLLGALASTGASLRWFRDEFCQAEKELAKKKGKDVYDLMTSEAAQSPPGSQGIIFLPYMMGERSPIWNSRARGIFFGLSLSASRKDMIRSILEGTSFALRHNMEIAREAGIEISEIRSVGGGTRSKLWNQVKANVLGIPVNIPEVSTGASFGAAVLAGYGAGLFPDVKNTLEGMVRVKECYEPQPEYWDLYSEMYSIYRDVYSNLENEFDRLSSTIQNK